MEGKVVHWRSRTLLVPEPTNVQTERGRSSREGRYPVVGYRLPDAGESHCSSDGLLDLTALLLFDLDKGPSLLLLEPLGTKVLRARIRRALSDLDSLPEKPPSGSIP